MSVGYGYSETLEYHIISRLAMAEPLCKRCTDIIKLRYIRTIHNPEFIMIFHCPVCHRDYHEYQIIWSNYTWLYREEEKDYE